jgi:hypothetical protein
MTVTRIIEVMKAKTPVIQPMWIPPRIVTGKPVRRRYRFTASVPAPSIAISASTVDTCPRMASRIKPMREANSEMRTVTGLRKPIVGSGRRTRGTSWPVCTGAAAIGGVTSTSASRCGLPHLWQNRASSGNRAPQLQYSGTFFSFS